MSDPKRHHYLPACYLAGFTAARHRDSPFAVYDRDKDEFRTQTPDGSAFQRFYYARTAADGTRDLSIERFFSQLEGGAKPIVDALERGSAVEPHERQTLALFIAFLHTRVPKFDRRLNEIGNVMDRVLRGDNLRATSPDDISSRSPDNERETTLDMMLKMASDLREHFCQFNWHIAHAEANSDFVTTDAPVVVLPPPDWNRLRGYGFATPGASTVVPLTARCALLMEGNSAGLRHAPMLGEEVWANNASIIARSERYAFARDGSYLRRLVLESGLRQIPLRPPIIVNGGA